MNIKDEIHNAWVEYLAIMTEPQLSGFDVLGAVNTAIGLIPGVGSFLSAAISLADNGSRIGGDTGSAAAESVAQLKQINSRINSRMNFFNQQFLAFRAATDE